MRPRHSHTPWIRYLPLSFGREREQRCMRQSNHLLLLRTVVAGEREFHVHRIRVTNRDGGLKPPELHAPFASEGVGSGLKVPRIIWHFTPMLARVSCIAMRL